MSCYLRHLKDILKEAGVEITSENRKEIDQAIHKAVGIKYKDCPHAWREVKKIISKREMEALAREIKIQLK